jgi:hypothetical protein
MGPNPLTGRRPKSFSGFWGTRPRGRTVLNFTPVSPLSNPWLKLGGLTVQGRTKPRPPFGFTAEDPPPRPRWRARREKFGGGAEELAAAPAPPALKYLTPLNEAERAVRRRLRKKRTGGLLAKAPVGPVEGSR